MGPGYLQVMQVGQVAAALGSVAAGLQGSVAAGLQGSVAGLQGSEVARHSPLGAIAAGVPFYHSIFVQLCAQTRPARTILGVS